MSLYQLAHDGDADTLLTKLRESESAAVRKRAAELLGGLGEDLDDVDRREAVGGLIEVAAGDEEATVRGAAIDALDGFGTGAVERLLAELTGVDPEEGADWVTAKRFAKALSADQPELRMAAANALGRIGDGDVVPRLVGALDDPDARVRQRAAAALGSVGHSRAIGPLSGLLEDETPAVKRAAADALAMLDGDAALAPLLSLLDDDGETLRWIAASALGNASSAKPVPALAAALTDESEPVRRSAVFSIVQLLSNAPQARSHKVRQAVVSELTAVDDAAVVDPLVAILSEGSQRPPRRNAAWLLGRVGSAESRDAVGDALVDALVDDDSTVSQFAATSLTNVGGERVERRLLDLVADGAVADDARAKAVFVLGQVGGDRSRERLERLTNEAEDKEVRKRAFSALSKLGGHA
ncbi:HEAT repeat domain-containing protein [Halobium salinum]|uniref:HEAT repeat domain-containing protein n=1 Tax=Halobium salinum TaxID=1364940 RepID=A0ABD5P7I4_9EURY|nr:HEAT repeat domain-containing protein [Halobium salinum]